MSPMPDHSLVSQTSSSTVKSAERALDVLELLARHARPVPTMTIARECGIPKSSAHHLLNVMRARHYVTYYEVERAWGLGVSVFEVGSAYLRSGPLQRLGRHLLVELTRELEETSHLAILHGTEVLYLDKEQPLRPGAKLVSEVGVRLPAHLTAVGRAILAALPEAQVRALYGSAGPLVRRTGRGPEDAGWTAARAGRGAAARLRGRRCDGDAGHPLRRRAGVLPRWDRAGGDRRHLRRRAAVGERAAGGRGACA